MATVSAGPAGPNVRGPYIQGGPGQRFIYLSWGTIDAAARFTVFRRDFARQNWFSPTSGTISSPLPDVPDAWWPGLGWSSVNSSPMPVLDQAAATRL